MARRRVIVELTGEDQHMLNEAASTKTAESVGKQIAALLKDGRDPMVALAKNGYQVSEDELQAVHAALSNRIQIAQALPESEARNNYLHQQQQALGTIVEAIQVLRA